MQKSCLEEELKVAWVLCGTEEVEDAVVEGLKQCLKLAEFLQKPFVLPTV